LVISQEYCKSRGAADIAIAAIAGGVDIIQMREKDKARSELIKLGKELSGICKKGGVTFIVNDDPLLAKEAGADGVHLGQSDLEKYPLKAARNILGKAAIIGVSTHSIDTFKKANSLDVDYIAYGPVFPTEIKTNCAGTKDLSQILAMANKPLFLIGGINLDNVDELLEKGAKNVSLIRAITQADDVAAAARSFKKKMTKGRLYGQIT